MLTIQVDSREKAKAIKRILETFDSGGVKYYISKLWVGDYMSLDNPRLIIDRKQNLGELANNLGQGHETFKNELVRAQEMGIKLIFLIEHSPNIKSIEDVSAWKNPRLRVSPYAMRGSAMAKTMRTMEEKYGCKFMFCSKTQTGKRIIELLTDRGPIDGRTS